jgi:Leucine-rich repeat (LRR) protein
VSIDFTLCTWLSELSIHGCRLRELPPSITLLTDLKKLDLVDNLLTSIDAIHFERMSKLFSLNVSGAQFRKNFKPLNIAEMYIGQIESTWFVVAKQLESFDIVD